MGRVWSLHLSGMNDVRTRFGPAPVLKTLTVGHEMLNVISTICELNNSFYRVERLLGSHLSPILIQFYLQQETWLPIQVWVFPESHANFYRP